MAAETAGGIKVRVAVESADACPVAAATDEDSTARSLSWTPVGDEVVEEFDLVGTDDDAPLPEDSTVVFEAGDHRRVRFTREDHPCICDRVAGHGSPVTDVTASNGTLRLTFHATEVETVREIIDDLSDHYASVRIDRLAQAGDDGTEDLVLVDRGRLTARQREVLETALEMGYFERPRVANASEVAAELDIAPSTFAEHLASGQWKVLDALLADS